MKQETINNIRVLTPNNGMWLYNSKDRVISDKVYLGINADATQWQEITEEYKNTLEALWESYTEANEEDYINALEEMGVSFNE